MSFNLGTYSIDKESQNFIAQVCDMNSSLNTVLFKLKFSKSSCLLLSHIWESILDMSFSSRCKYEILEDLNNYINDI